MRNKRLLTYQAIFGDVKLLTYPTIFAFLPTFAVSAVSIGQFFSEKAATIISIIEKLLTGTDTFPVIKSAEVYSFRVVKANFTGTYQKYSLGNFFPLYKSC